ncbi:MAG: ATP-dependent helicase [Candidatus Omnitrophica bacterium]|nr:ATP-dependent helicase [Candidatus Omnitrophota bacterium]
MQKQKKNKTYQEYYNQLNDEQKKVVDFVDGPVLVLAGPGTGKTQLLSVRAANIIQQKKSLAENILILTFSNAAANAMRERLALIIGHSGYEVEIETFHSFANSIVLESEGALKYSRDQIEIDEIEKVRAIEYILDNVSGVQPLRPFGAPYSFRSEIEKRISELKNEAIMPHEFKENIKNLEPDGVDIEEKHVVRLNALALIYEKYEQLKNENCELLFDQRGRRDYDDMILTALNAFRQDKTLRKFFQRQYKYIMVDEFQDTNGTQLELLFSILDPDTKNICCVGDDDQSIFRFQGASLSNFRILKERLPHLQTIELFRNYRSVNDILSLADRIIKQIPEDERLSSKKLVGAKTYSSQNVKLMEFATSEEELSFLVDEIEKQADIIRSDAMLTDEERQKPYNNIAVLVRKRAQILKVIDAFLRAGIPYATDGKEDIRQEKRVRQMLDVLELANIDIRDNEKKSLTLYKILTADYLEVDLSDIMKLVSYVNAKKYSKNSRRGKVGVNFFQEFHANFPVEKDEVPSKENSNGLDIARELMFKDIGALHKAAWAINRLLQDASNRPVHDLLLQYIADTRLYRYILDRYEQDKVLKIRDLRALSSFINKVKESDLSKPALNLQAFMEELSMREAHGMPLEGNIATQSQNGVRLYTAHSSKGLEFYTVFVPFCLGKKNWPARTKIEIIPLPPDIYKSKKRVEDKNTRKLLAHYDEIRLFYVASTRAKASIFYTAAPEGKVIITPFLNQVGINHETAVIDEEQFLINFLASSKKRDPVDSAVAVLSDVISTLVLNPTSLNNYVTCRRKFLYDNVLRLPGRKNQHLVFGNCAHKALEEVYLNFMKTEVFPDFNFFKEAFKNELEFQGANNQIKKWCLDKVDVTIRAWYEGESRFPVMPVDLENKLEIVLTGGILFKGTFDKIELETDGSIRVVDYKTGKPDKHIKAIANCHEVSAKECDDYFRQLIAYKMLYERTRHVNDKKIVSTGVLKFLEPAGATVKKYNLEKGIFRDEIVKLTDTMVRNFEIFIVECWKDIQALKFEQLKERDDKEKCARCEYDSICWG